MTDCTDKQTCVILESISRVKCDKITQLTLMMIQQRELLGKYQYRLRLLQWLQAPGSGNPVSVDKYCHWSCWWCRSTWWPSWGWGRWRDSSGSGCRCCSGRWWWSRYWWSPGSTLQSQRHRIQKQLQTLMYIPWRSNRSRSDWRMRYRHHWGTGQWRRDQWGLEPSEQVHKMLNNSFITHLH